MILVDSNVLMYAAGAEHPNKRPAVGFLERVAAGRELAVTDAEVLQEIIHRYRSLNRWSDGRRVYALARQVIPEVLPVTAAVMDEARDLVDRSPGLSARDAVHAAVVRVYGLTGICSFDSDFDSIAGLTRVSPREA